MNHFTSVLAARVGASQAKALVRADSIGNKVDREILKVWKRVIHLVKNPGPNFQEDLINLMWLIGGTAIHGVGQGLALQAKEVSKEVSKVVFDSLPPGHRNLLAEIHGPKTEATKPTQRQLDEMREMIFPPQTQAEADRIVYKPTAGVSWQARLAQQTRLANPDQLASTISSWRASGRAPGELLREITPMVQGVRTSARRVARTESQRVAMQTRMESYERLGDLVIGYQIHATMDSHTRPHHAARNGQTYFKNPKPGQLSVSEMPIPPQESDGSVAHNCRCVTGKSRVNGYVKSISRALYEGEFFKIRTAGGAEITVTANHPIATQRGLVHANEVLESDYLITDACGVGDFSRNIDDKIPTIEDVFESFVEHGLVFDRPSSLDFHGDGKSMNSKIDIVFADRVLMDCWNPNFPKSGHYDGFINSRPSHVCESCLPSSLLVGHSGPLDGLRNTLTPWSNIGIQEPFEKTERCSRFGSALVGSPTGDSILFGKGIKGLSRLVSFDKVGGNFFGLGNPNSFRFSPEFDPVAGHPSFDCIPFDPKFSANLTKRHAGKVSFDKVVNISRFHGKSFVYSIDSHNGYYMGSDNNVSIVQGNCWLTPIVDVQPQVEKDPVAKAVFQDAEKNLVPDPASYHDWFGSAPLAEKIATVGLARLAAAAERAATVTQAVPWTAMLKADGSLLTTREIRAETLNARQKRIARVNSIIQQRRLLAKRIAQYGYLPPRYRGAVAMLGNRGV